MLEGSCWTAWSESALRFTNIPFLEGGEGRVGISFGFAIYSVMVIPVSACGAMERSEETYTVVLAY